MSRVTELPAADPIGARAHFEALLAFETDCWDVHASLDGDAQDFVLLDVRAPQWFEAGHVPGAKNPRTKKNAFGSSVLWFFLFFSHASIIVSRTTSSSVVMPSKA